MPFRSIKTLQSWLDEFAGLGYPTADAARVIVQDGADDEGIEMEVTESTYSLSPDDLIFNDEDTLYPPDGIAIVSQTVKVHSGGAVVDVVIDVESAGASQFEIRVTK